MNGRWELTRQIDELADELVSASGPQLTLSWSTIKRVVRFAWWLVEDMRWIRDDDGFILAWCAHYELQYPAAALALRCGLFVDAQGELQPRAAAMAFGAALTGEPKLSGSTADKVQAWLSKLQRLEQACLDEYVERMQAQAQFKVILVIEKVRESIELMDDRCVHRKRRPRRCTGCRRASRGSRNIGSTARITKLS